MSHRSPASLRPNVLACATALATAAGAAAQTANVQIYGIVDVGIQYTTGVRGGSVTQLASGIMEGSRLGLRGTEDLGGGWRAMFAAEMRFEGDTGALGNRPVSGTQLPDRLLAGLPPAVQAALTNVAIGPTLGVNTGNRLFDRQVYVGLVTPVGALLAGRQYTPAFEISNRFDTFSNATAASPGQLISIPAGVDIRADNSLMYRVELQGAFATAMYSFGEVAGGASRSSIWGINAGYAIDRFGVGIGYNERKNSLGRKALNSLIGGASFNAGGATLVGMVARVREPNPSSGPELRAGLISAGVPAALVDTGVLPRLMQDARLYHIGARVPLGTGNLMLGYSQVDDRRAANADAKSYGVAYTYPLSRRTDLNLAVTQVDNGANAQVLPGGNGFLGGVTANAGKDATVVQFSLRHKF